MTPPTASTSPTSTRPTRQRRLRRGVYLLPSLFTMGNMILGFYAVILGFRAYQTGADGLFVLAALLIFAAAVFDGLDGRIARMVGTESDFGKEYDSLADAITFGVAPALLTFFWGLHDLGRIGWLVPAFYMVCCVTRLARFNVQTHIVDSRFFVGLPTPAAACAISSILFFAPDLQEWHLYMAWLVMISLVIIGTLMVSTFRYRSFKKFDLKKRWSYRALIPVVAVILVTALYPTAFFLAIAVLYSASGPLAWLWGRIRSRSSEPAEVTAQEPEAASSLSEEAQ